MSKLNPAHWRCQFNGDKDKSADLFISKRIKLAKKKTNFKPIKTEIVFIQIQEFNSWVQSKNEREYHCAQIKKKM